jgi:hypothetical protein
MTFEPKSKNIPYTLSNNNGYVNATLLYYGNFGRKKLLKVIGFKSEMTLNDL